MNQVDVTLFLPFFLTYFLSFHHSRFSFHINVKTQPLWSMDYLNSGWTLLATAFSRNETIARPIPDHRQKDQLGILKQVFHYIPKMAGLWWPHVRPLQCSLVTFLLFYIDIFKIISFYSHCQVLQKKINVIEKHGNVKRQKNWLKVKQRSNSYLPHICWLPQNVEGV